jgi:hypothetical protein
MTIPRWFSEIKLFAGFNFQSSFSLEKGQNLLREHSSSVETIFNGIWLQDTLELCGPFQRISMNNEWKSDTQIDSFPRRCSALIFTRQRAECSRAETHQCHDLARWKKKPNPTYIKHLSEKTFLAVPRNNFDTKKLINFHYENFHRRKRSVF